MARSIEPRYRSLPYSDQISWDWKKTKRSRSGTIRFPIGLPKHPHTFYRMLKILIEMVKENKSPNYTWEEYRDKAKKDLSEKDKRNTGAFYLYYVFKDRFHKDWIESEIPNKEFEVKFLLSELKRDIYASARINNLEIPQITISTYLEEVEDLFR